MKRVVVIANGHQAVEEMLAADYTFVYFDARHVVLDQFLIAVRGADLCLTTLNYYNDMLQLFPAIPDRRKIVLVASDDSCRGSYDCSDFTYGITCGLLYDHFEGRIKGNIYVVPISVNPAAFCHSERSGFIHQLGFVGTAADWALAIGLQSDVPISIAATARPEWYGSIDVLLVSTESDRIVMEAIASGVLVIGKAVGHFSWIPGPKSATVEEGVGLVKALGQNQAIVRELAKEQYACIGAAAESWRTLFESVH